MPSDEHSSGDQSDSRSATPASFYYQAATDDYTNRSGGSRGRSRGRPGGRQARDTLVGAAALTLAVSYLLAAVLAAIAIPWRELDEYTGGAAFYAVDYVASVVMAFGFGFIGIGFLRIGSVGGRPARDVRVRWGALLVGIGYLLWIVLGAAGAIGSSAGSAAGAGVGGVLGAVLAALPVVGALMVASAFAARAHSTPVEATVERNRRLRTATIWIGTFYGIVVFAYLVQLFLGSDPQDSAGGADWALFLWGCLWLFAIVAAGIGFRSVAHAGSENLPARLLDRETALVVAAVLMALASTILLLVMGLETRDPGFGARDWREKLYLAAISLPYAGFAVAGVLAAAGFVLSRRALLRGDGGLLRHEAP